MLIPRLWLCENDVRDICVLVENHREAQIEKVAPSLIDWNGFNEPSSFYVYLWSGLWIKKYIYKKYTFENHERNAVNTLLLAQSVQR